MLWEKLNTNLYKNQIRFISHTQYEIELHICDDLKENGPQGSGITGGVALLEEVCHYGGGL